MLLSILAMFGWADLNRPGGDPRAFPRIKGDHLPHAQTKHGRSTDPKWLVDVGAPWPSRLTSVFFSVTGPPNRMHRRPESARYIGRSNRSNKITSPHHLGSSPFKDNQRYLSIDYLSTTNPSTMEKQPQAQDGVPPVAPADVSSHFYYT
jgi:hypothetical protein